MTKISGTQAITRNASIAFNGEWDPTALLSVINRFSGADNGAFLRGKTVLDIGSNTGGLSIELARLGAVVTAAEPDPYENTFAQTATLVDEIAAEEKLSLTNIKADLHEVLSWADEERFEGYDITIFFGLLYHFRNPQYLLDRLNLLLREGALLFLSTQTHPGDELAMINRMQPGIMREGHMPSNIPLSGWHITQPCLTRMLEWSGFGEIEWLSNKDFPYKEPGLTNSSYLFCKKVKHIDLDAENYHFYPR